MTKYSTIIEIENCISKIVSPTDSIGILNDRADLEELLDQLYDLARKYPDELIKIFKNRRYESTNLLWALRGLPNENVVEFLKDVMLNHTNWEMRYIAAEALAMIEEGIDFNEVFIPALKDNNNTVQFIAVTSLEKYGDKRALSGLREIIKDKKLQQSSPGLIDSAKRTIKRLEALE